MIPEILVLLVSLAVLIIASVSLGAANKCTTANDMSIIKNTNYFLIVFAILIIFGMSFMLYKKYRSQENDMTMLMSLPTMAVVAGLIIFQIGFAQYAALSNIVCDATVQMNLKNCYITFMVLGVLLSAIGLGTVYFGAEKILKRIEEF